MGVSRQGPSTGLYVHPVHVFYNRQITLVSCIYKFGKMWVQCILLFFNVLYSVVFSAIVCQLPAC